jgi:hypothetical protein
LHLPVEPTDTNVSDSEFWTDLEKENIPLSWIGRRVRIITTVTTYRSSQDEGVLVNLNEFGIVVSLPRLTGSGEDVVFHPWSHVYQLGPIME